MSIVHFSKYSSVALMSAASDWIVFSIAVSVLNQDNLIGLMISRIVGGMVSFLSNRHWTWGTNRHVALTQQGRRFIILYIFSYVTSIVLFTLLSKTLNPYLAKLFTDIACFLINFMVMQSYVFHQRGGIIAWLFDANSGDEK